MLTFTRMPRCQFAPCPSSRRTWNRSFGRAKYAKYVCCGICILMLSVRVSGQGIPERGAADAPDVVVLVRPGLTSSAVVAVAYARRVAHRRVRAEIGNLAAAGGWRLDRAPLVQDDTIRHDRIDRFPLTTAALFTLRGASMARSQVPQLRPFLSAFQAWNRVEVMFDVNGCPAPQAVADYDSAQLSVRLVKDQGVYRYQAEIRDHRGSLPGLETTRNPAATSTDRAGSPAGSVKKTVWHQNSRMFLLPWLFGIGGALLLLAAAISNFRQRAGVSTDTGARPVVEDKEKRKITV